MRILLINKFHYLRGGAERAYFDTARILESQGHTVAFFSMWHPKNETTKWGKYFVEQIEYEESESLPLWRKYLTASRMLWNFEARRKLEELIKDFQPDVAHLHNIYHQLSPSIIWTLKKHHMPMVMTLHDYKVVSPNYNLFVRGKIWEGNKPGRYWKCVQDRCVKNSFAKSLVCTLEAYLHRWLRSYEQIDAFIAPSRFLIGKFREFGFQKEIEYVPQPLMPRITNHESRIKEKKPDYFLYFGRLSVEKGVNVAIEAMQYQIKNQKSKIKNNVKLLIAGKGLEKINLLKRTHDLKLTKYVEFLGYKTGEELENLIAGARAVVVPSLWYENMPYTMLEALGHGTLVIGSDLGGIPERIQEGENGWLFRAGDAKQLAEKMSLTQSLPEGKMEITAQESVRELTPARYYTQLSNLYQKLLQRV